MCLIVSNKLNLEVLSYKREHYVFVVKTYILSGKRLIPRWVQPDYTTYIIESSGKNFILTPKKFYTQTMVWKSRIKYLDVRTRRYLSKCCNEVQVKSDTTLGIHCFYTNKICKIKNFVKSITTSFLSIKLLGLVNVKDIMINGESNTLIVKQIFYPSPSTFKRIFYNNGCSKYLDTYLIDIINKQYKILQEITM
jgi:hypothetical protein